MLSVGRILKSERKKRGYGLDEVEEKLRVRKKYLQAIEIDEWNTFPSRVYCEGVLKIYARFLQINDVKLLAFFRREYERDEEIKFKKRLPSDILASPAQRVMGIIIALLFIGIGLYFGFQLIRFFSPPMVTIVEPKEEIFKRVSSIVIRGITEKDAEIRIFGDRVYQKPSGEFEYSLPLKIGKTPFELEVIGANGKKRVIKRDFIRTK